MQADVSMKATLPPVCAVDGECGPIAALVNNAGMLETQMRVDEMDAGRLTRVFAANVVGTMLCCREAVRRMSTRYGGTGGAIVNLSSAAARLGSPGEYVDYAAAKAAVDTLTIGLARSRCGRVRVNAVRPDRFTPRFTRAAASRTDCAPGGYCSDEARPAEEVAVNPVASPTKYVRDRRDPM